MLTSLFITFVLYEKFILPELQIPMIVTLLFIASFLVVKELKKRISKFELHSKISYIIFALFMVIGDSFKMYGSLYGVFGNPFKDTDILVKLFEDFAPLFSILNGPFGNIVMLIGSICKCIGYYFIIGYFIEFIKLSFSSLEKIKATNNYQKFTNKIFDNNVFLKVFIILIVAWLPYLIIKFPGSVSSDAIMQINQFLGNEPLTTHHPLFSTFLIGICIKFGLLFESQNLGILLYIIFQYVVMAAVFSLGIYLINNYQKCTIYNWLLLIFYALSPAFPSYATFVVKDTFYCTMFVLFILLLIKTIFDLTHNTLNTKNLVSFILTSFIVMISRNNGVYSVIPTLFALIIVSLFKSKEKIKISVLLTIPILLYSGYNYFQYDILEIQKGSIKEALSIPFQQTARYIKTHPDDITDYEKEVIDKVLDYENIAELYIPTVSDPVKRTYKGNDNALNEYFKVWFEQLKKHPQTYIEATLNSSYVAFYPDTPNIRAYGVISDWENSQPDGIFSLLRVILLAFVMGLSLLPVISILINPVFYIWLLIYLVIRCICKKEFIKLIIYIPMIIQVLVIIAGPAVLNHPRYIYPIYWSILLTIPFVLKNISNTKVLTLKEGKNN